MLRIQKSSFCQGKNDRGWVASFDWFIRPDTVVKIMEGKYDDHIVNGMENGSRKNGGNINY